MKKIFFKIISIFILLFSFSNISLAEKYKVDPKIKTIFSNFTKKLEKKYTEKKEIIFLEKINEKIQFFLNNKKLSSKKYKLLKDILVLSNEEIFKLNNTINLKNNSQKILEANITRELRDKLNKIKENSLSNKFKNNSKIKKIKVSNKFEFTENNKIKKIIFKKYFEINKENYSYFNKKIGYLLIKENGKILFVENGKIEEKIPYSQAYKYTKGHIKESNNYSKDNYYFEDNNSFYLYEFQIFTLLEDKYGFYKKDLIDNNFNIEDYILYIGTNKKYNFIKDYTKVKLINSDIIYGITDKKDFLNDLINDKLYLTGDTDHLFEKLKSQINSLTKNKNKKDKIKLIYNFILSNIEYTKEINLNNKEIFSGILTYKNKSGVCEGYVKLASYAYKFAGIKNVKTIRGDVIDAEDFPKIGHAWLKIGDLYYDPTFDDPIGQVKTKNFSEYKYFGLPKDLLYANRYDYGTIPEFLKEKTLNYRIDLVNKKLSKLADKYKNSNYKILEGAIFYKKNNIEVGKNITIEQAKKIIPYYEVTEKSNGELYFYQNGIKKNITKLQYYIVDKETIEQIFAQRNYNTQGLYLFNWNKKDGNKEWRIGFNVIIK